MDRCFRHLFKHGEGHRRTSIAIRLEAIAIRVEAIASREEAIAIRFLLLLEGLLRPSPCLRSGAASIRPVLGSATSSALLLAKVQWLGAVADLGYDQNQKMLISDLHTCER